jgi:phage major head subunit gpT-like protein
MLRNSTSLTTLGIGFNAAFQGGLSQATPQRDRVATRVPSSTSENEYGWLGQLPNVREWIGDRVVHGLEAHDYTIKNRKFELTIGVKGDDIDDDNIGIYGPMFTEMGRSVDSHYEQLVWALLKAGFDTPCYDGQNFFDTDHPVLAADGVTVTSVANTDGGAGAPWFLIDDSRALKPILLQIRKEMSQLKSKDKPTDDNVFDRDEYKYGVDGRHNVGFGFWQFAWGSKQTLDAAHYATARAALMGMKGDHGRPLGIMPRILVVGPSLESAGRKLLNSEYGAGGETNEWKGTAELVVVPWLA